MLLSASEIISRTWKTFTTHFAAIAKFMVILGLCSVAIKAIQAVSLLAWLSESIFLVVLAKFISIIVVLLLGFWFHLALIKSLGEAYQNQAVEHFGSALKSTQRPYWSACGAAILVWLAIFFGSWLIIPGIIFAVWFIFTRYVILFERQSALAGIQRSKELVVGRWWAIAWRIVGPVLAFAALLFVGQAIIELPFAWLPGNAAAYIDLVLTIITDGAFLSLSTLVIVILYFSARDSFALSESSQLEK